jgi:hypothetical protein
MKKHLCFFISLAPKSADIPKKKTQHQMNLHRCIFQKGHFPSEADFSRDENKKKCHFYVFAQVIVITFEHFGSI